MEKHALFLQDEITMAFIDDFMVLPAVKVWANVYEGLSEAVQRHDDMFRGVH